MADKLIEDDNTFCQSDITDEETITNQQVTQTADKTKRKMTNSIDFPTITNFSITFDFKSKIRFKQIFSNVFQSTYSDIANQLES